MKKFVCFLSFLILESSCGMLTHIKPHMSGQMALRCFSNAIITTTQPKINDESNNTSDKHVAIFDTTNTQQKQLSDSAKSQALNTLEESNAIQGQLKTMIDNDEQKNTPWYKSFNFLQGLSCCFHILMLLVSLKCAPMGGCSVRRHGVEDIIDKLDDIEFRLYQLNNRG